MADDLRAYYASAGIPKTYREKKTTQRIRVKPKSKEQRDHITEIREYVFARERGRCRCCRRRTAQSMHELVSRGAGGKVSKRNSIAVCGQLGNGHECHGLLQAKRITFTMSDSRGAEASIYFMPMDQRARDWMKLGEAHGLESAPMREIEAAE